MLPIALAFDSWAWLVWARELVNGSLVTTGGPSWKPGTVALALPTVPFGGAAPTLWLLIERTAALLALAAAARLAWTLVSRWPESSRAAAALGSIAAVGLLFASEWWLPNSALGNSEGIVAALALVAVDAAVRRREGQCLLALWALCTLRPEAFIFLLIAVVFAWRGELSRQWRGLLIAAVLSVPVLWVVPELIGSGNAFRAGEAATAALPGRPSQAEFPAYELARQALDAVWFWAAVLGLITVSIASVRRVLPVLATAAVAVAWFSLVAVMSQAGFSGNVRYLAPSLALVAVLGGVGVGVAVGWLAKQLRGGRQVLIYGTAAVLGALSVMAFGLRFADNRADFGYRAQLHSQLGRAVADAGGVALLNRCAPAVSLQARRSELSWRLDLTLDQVRPSGLPPYVLYRSRLTPGSPLVPRTVVAEGGQVRSQTALWQVVAACE